MQTEAIGQKAVKLLEPGDMFGDYTVEKLLGKGGMGAVYLVRAPGGERYAVKVMFPEIADKNQDYRTRFAREAEFAMTLRHKNLIQVYDAGEDPDTGLCYIIMDYVPGGSVKDRLREHGRIPVAEAVSITAQIAIALELAHRHGVIHRDIKPDNIMFDADGTPKLADLGVAKFTDEAHKTTVTTTGMIIGTPAYMAPEQMMDSHHIDARADIYALGVVLYEMLTGKRPTEGSTAVELLAKALKGEPLPDVRTMCPEISAAIAHVISLMCAPKPEDRPTTTLAVAQLLQQAAMGQLKLPKKKPRAADARRTKRPFPVAACVMGALVLGAAVFGWRAWSSRQKTATGATGVPPVAATTSTALPTGTGGSPVGGDVLGSGARAISSASDEKLPKETSPKPKDLSLDLGGGVKMEMVGCPAARFQRRVLYVKNRQTLEITRPFWIGKFPVTVEQWERLMPRTEPPQGATRDAEYPRVPVMCGKLLPKTSLSRRSAEEFMDKLTSMNKDKIPVGYKFRFPTMAEWAHAFMAMSSDPSDPYADNNQATRADCDASFVTREDSLSYWGKRAVDMSRFREGCWVPYIPVGQRRPNKWGICDMGGVTVEPLLDSGVYDSDDGSVDARFGRFLHRYAGTAFADGARDPLIFEAYNPGDVRRNLALVNQGGGPNDCYGQHRYASIGPVPYGFCYRTPGTEHFVMKLRLCIGPDLLKERGIAPPKPEGSSSVASASSALGSGTPAPAPVTGEKRPKETSPRPKPLSFDLGGGVTMEMVGCPAGTFMMGYGKEASGDHKPFNKPHKVAITRPFWIAKYPLTPHMIEALGICPEVSEHVKQEQKRIWDGIGLRVPYNPLARAPMPAFVQARIFRHLNEKIKNRPQGYIFRCPTSAEWEYAVKADESDPTFVDANLSMTSVIHAIWGETVQAKRFLDEYTHFRDHPQDNRITWMMPLEYTKPNPWGLQALLVGRTFMLDSVDPDKIVKAGRGSLIHAIKDNARLSSPERDPVYVAALTSPDECRLARGSMALSNWDFPERGSCSVLVTLGPDLLKERGITPPKPDANGRDARSPRNASSADDDRSPNVEPYKLLSERPKPLTIKLGKGEQLELMGCPAGTFTMGYEGGAPAHVPHTVTISRPFWIGKIPVTRAQWECISPALRCEPAMQAQIDALGGAQTPQTCCSRRQIDEFIEKLNRRHAKALPVGFVFRLPTLAEWEYACRANGDPEREVYARPKMWGAGLNERAQIGVLPSEKREMLERKGVPIDAQRWKGAYWQVAASVATKKPNAWGLYDMLGNQAEIVLDTFSSQVMRDIEQGFCVVKSPDDLPWIDKDVDPLFWNDGDDAAFLRPRSREGKAVWEVGGNCCWRNAVSFHLPSRRHEGQQVEEARAVAVHDESAPGKLDGAGFP